MLTANHRPDTSARNGNVEVIDYKMTLLRHPDSLDRLFAGVRNAPHVVDEMPVDFGRRTVARWMPEAINAPVWMYSICKRALGLSLALALLCLVFGTGWQRDSIGMSGRSLADSIVLGILLP